MILYGVNGDLFNKKNDAPSNAVENNKAPEKKESVFGTFNIGFELGKAAAKKSEEKSDPKKAGEIMSRAALSILAGPDKLPKPEKVPEADLKK